MSQLLVGFHRATPCVMRKMKSHLQQVSDSAPGISQNSFQEALDETLGQQAGEERAAAVFGPRFYLHLLIQVKSVESHMLVKQTNLYVPNLRKCLKCSVKSLKWKITIVF